jgi:hypothetical protein
MNPLYNERQAPTTGTLLSREDATRIVRELTAHFGVPTPRMEWNQRTRRGRYSVRMMAIKIGPRIWRGVNTVVHEFAHHLDLVRRGQAGTMMPRPRVPYRLSGWFDPQGQPLTLTRSGRRDFHGPSFTRALEECAAAVFGDVELYDWAHEYKQVRREHGFREPVRTPWVNPIRMVLVSPSVMPLAAAPVSAGQSLDRAAQKRASRLARLARRANQANLLSGGTV